MKGICSKEDRISHLPDHVLHEILSLLSNEDATKTSILSKHWNSVWNSFPILVFDEYDFAKNHEKVRTNLCESIDRTMRRRYESSIFTERLDIRIYHERRCGTKIIKDLDSWIDFAVRLKLKQLILEILDDQIRFEDEKNYVLPQCVWNSPWLRVLDVTGCEFSGSINTSGTVGISSSLRELSLHNVRIDETAFHHVIASCFHLEGLWITRCVGFKVLNVVGLKGIHTVFFNLSVDQSVFVESPGLQFLCFCGRSSNVEQIIQASFLKKLKEICLFKMDIDEFDKLIPEFPWLEKLSLDRCKSKESFTVSSGRLMKFSLIDCYYVEYIKLDTCRLNKFKYSCNRRLKAITWVEASDEVVIKHEHGLGYWSRLMSFDKIAMYLVNLSFCKVLTLVCGKAKWIASEELDGLSCDIQQLRIKITEGRHGQIGLRSCRFLLEEFLRISRRPSSVLIELWEKESLDSFLKLDFLYQHEEIDQGQLNNRNCGCGGSSCWRCCLGEVRISQSLHAMRGRDARKLVEFFKVNALCLKKISYVESKADIHSQASDWCLASLMKIKGPPRHLVFRFPFYKGDTFLFCA